ncbi:MAG: pilus assembly protein PilM [Candidatus Magasanikbacteria bacterium]|nr:pilus assembly protein PilM [Candidatus Magasanikbacteria bacterium]
MLFGKPHSFLGIDLGAGGVKLVELKTEKHRPVLFTYAVTTDGQDVHRLLHESVNTPEEGKKQNQAKVKEYAAVLKAVCARANAKSKNAVVSLPVSSVFHALVTLPAAKKEDFDHFLKAEVKKLLPYPLEEAVLDYQILPGEEKATTKRVLVNAVPRDLVVFYTEVFAEAGLKLEALEPESVALARSLIGRDQSVTMLVDVGAERTNFFIIDGGVPITHHSTEVGGNRLTAIFKNIWQVDSAAAEILKMDLFTELTRGSNHAAVSPDPSAVPLRPRSEASEASRFKALTLPVVDPILKEIQYGFEVYLKQSGNEQKRPEKVVLTGGAAFLPYLSEQIAANFKIKCFIGDPWGRVLYQDRLKPILRAVGPRLAVAIGLALRSMV